MFDQDLVVFSDKTYQNKYEVMNDLAALVSDKVTAVEDYAAAVKEREDTFCTYIEYGVAIPHAKTDSVTEPFVIYARLEPGVVWGDDGEEATHVFMLGVPKEKGGNLHLRIISELSKNLMRDAFREQLFKAATTEEVTEILKNIEKEITK